MKYILYPLPAILLACSHMDPASGPVVPQVVLQAFKADFPYAESLSWEEEDQDLEGQFYLEGREMSAVYDRSGKLWETEETIAVTSLPQEATAYIRSFYPDSEIKEASKIILDHHHKVLYEAEVNGEDLVFNESGLFLKVGRN